jgi:hypothetical protein
LQTDGSSAKKMAERMGEPGRASTVRNRYAPWPWAADEETAVVVRRNVGGKCEGQ